MLAVSRLGKMKHNPGNKTGPAAQLNEEETAMKSRLTLAVLLLASLPGFGQFNFQITAAT